MAPRKEFSLKNPDAQATPGQQLGLYKWLRDRAIFDHKALTQIEAHSLLTSLGKWAAGELTDDEIKSLVNPYLPTWTPKRKAKDPGNGNGNGKPKPAPKEEVKEAIPEPEPVQAQPTPTDKESLLAVLEGILKPDLFKALQETIKTIEIEAQPKPADPKTKDYVKPEIWDRVFKMVKANIPIMVYGPAGTGKSRMFEEMAKALKLDYFCMSFSGGLRKSDVFWSTQIINGETKTLLSPLLEAVQKPCLVLLDEIVMAEPDLAGGLNSLIEPHSRSIQTPAGRIECHPECRIVAAANTAGRSYSDQFTAATRCDESLLDRLCITFFMDYSPKVESRIMKAYGLSPEEKNYLANSLGKLRQEIKVAGIRFDPSTRRLIASIRAFRAGLSLEEAFEIAFLSQLGQAERQKIKMGGVTV